MKRSFLDFINILGVIIVGLVVLFALYTLFVDKPFYEPASYLEEGDSGNSESYTGYGDTTGSYDAEKEVDRLEVNNISGRIVAEKWNNNTIRLEYIKKGPGKYPEVKTEFSGGKLTIAAVYPKTVGSFGSVDFLLKIPENLEYLKAKSVSGNISVTGLGNTEQDLSSTSGSVRTDGSGDLVISSVSGTLEFSSAGENISASTTSGRIEGRLEINSGTGKIKMKSVSGQVELDVPQDLDADMDLHSVSGSVSSALPVAVTETKRNTIRGVTGSGGTEIEISTVSGAVKITK